MVLDHGHEHRFERIYRADQRLFFVIAERVDVWEIGKRYQNPRVLI